METYDIIIIGGGPGGYVAAIRAAQLGKKVCLIEKEWVGGTCLNIGCIPTKALISSAEVYADAKNASDFGVEISGEVSYSLERMMKRKCLIVSRTVKGVKYLLKTYSIEVKRGSAEFSSPGKVKVNGEEIISEKIIVATGSKPKLIKGLEPDGKLILTSRDALEIDAVPKRLLVVGAGVIGVEMATFFNLLGTEVTIVEMLDSLLPTLHAEKLTDTLTAQLKKKGVKILTSTTVESQEKKGDSLSVTFSNGEGAEFDRMLVAVGRCASYEGIDTNSLGLKMEDGFIKVNGKMETNIKGVYAVGDVVGGMLLAHKASREGIVAVQNIFGNETSMNYGAVPNCIFTHPPAAFVGMTEKIAKEKGLKVKIGEYQYVGNARAHTLGAKEGYARVITDNEGVVIGGEIVGVHADSMISEFAMACELKLNVKDIERVIYPHPTLGEVLFEAFHDAEGKAIHKGPKK
jgi:dihydrolipoamide dehydrogenase